MFWFHLAHAFPDPLKQKGREVVRGGFGDDRFNLRKANEDDLIHTRLDQRRALRSVAHNELREVCGDT